MTRETRQIDLGTHPDVNKLVEDVAADHEPRVLNRAGKPVAVIVSPEDYVALRQRSGKDIWAGYDPERLQQVYDSTPPLFENDAEREKFKQEMREARTQAPRRWERELYGDDDSDN